MTNFPVLRVAVAAFVVISTNFSSTMVYAFQPFMVNWFFPNMTKEELGWRTGYLGMSYYIGSFFGGLFWGWLADNLGRRPSLLIGLIGSIIFGTLFGLSQTYTWALFGRFSCGFASCVGYVVILPYISETVDNEDQLPRALSIVSGISVVGRMFAPVAGGFLAQPATKYRIFDNDFFCSYPYILAQLLSVLLHTMSLLGVYLILEETLTKRKLDNFESLNSQNCEGQKVSDDSSTEDDELISNKAKKRGCCASTYQHIVTVQRDQLTCCISGWKCKRSNPDSDPPPPIKERLLFIMRAIINRSVLSSIAVNVVLGSAGLMIHEALILLIISDKDHGGHDMNDSSVGLCFMVAGTVEMLYQFLLYPRLVKLLGWRKTLIGGVALFSIATFVFPWGSSIPIKDTKLYHEHQKKIIFYCGGNSSTSEINMSFEIGQQPYLVWIIVVTPFVFVMIGRMTILVASSVLLNNSSIPATRGTVNGIGHALNAFLRAVGYALAATLFAWSQSNGKGWPLNYHFFFILLSILLMTTIPILISLPQSLETTKS